MTIMRDNSKTLNLNGVYIYDDKRTSVTNRREVPVIGITASWPSRQASYMMGLRIKINKQQKWQLDIISFLRQMGDGAIYHTVYVMNLYGARLLVGINPRVSHLIGEIQLAPTARM